MLAYCFIFVNIFAYDFFVLRIVNFRLYFVIKGNVMQDKELLILANQAKVYAYTPYYQYRVGAALLCKNGKVFTGCNIENAAGTSICAERVAFSKAISEGESEFIAIAVAGDGKGFITPCGICRQFMVEFSPELWVISGNELGELNKQPLHELLPQFFGPKSLTE